MKPVCTGITKPGLRSKPLSINHDIINTDVFKNTIKANRVMNRFPSKSLNKGAMWVTAILSECKMLHSDRRILRLIPPGLFNYFFYGKNISTLLLVLILHMKWNIWMFNWLKMFLYFKNKPQKLKTNVFYRTYKLHRDFSEFKFVTYLLHSALLFRLIRFPP